jgi:hypothetical protein
VTDQYSFVAKQYLNSYYAASRRGFRQQFLDDGFDVLRLQADGADDALAVNDGA